jgi:hypothetical protein
MRIIHPPQGDSEPYIKKELEGLRKPCHSHPPLFRYLAQKSKASFFSMNCGQPSLAISPGCAHRQVSQPRSGNVSAANDPSENERRLRE